jgi:hypothetical protein
VTNPFKSWELSSLTQLKKDIADFKETLELALKTGVEDASLIRFGISIVTVLT